MDAGRKVEGCLVIPDSMLTTVPDALVCILDQWPSLFHTLVSNLLCWCSLFHQKQRDGTWMNRADKEQEDSQGARTLDSRLTARPKEWL